jgi:hypothetical protein
MWTFRQSFLYVPNRTFNENRPLLVALYSTCRQKYRRQAVGRGEANKRFSVLCNSCVKGSFVWKSCVIYERNVIGHVCLCCGLWVCSDLVQREKDMERVLFWLPCQLAEILWRRLVKYRAGGIIMAGAMTRFRSLGAGISPRGPGFNPRPLHVEIVVDKVALGPDFLRVFRFSPASRILPFAQYSFTQRLLTLYNCINWKRS